MRELEILHQNVSNLSCLRAHNGHSEVRDYHTQFFGLVALHLGLLVFNQVILADSILCIEDPDDFDSLLIKDLYVVLLV